MAVLMEEHLLLADAEKAGQEQAVLLQMDTALEAAVAGMLPAALVALAKLAS